MSNSQEPEIFDAELLLEILGSEFEANALLSEITFDDFSCNSHSIEPY